MGLPAEERTVLKERAGEYTKSVLNDLRLEDGKWLTSVRVDGKTWATRSFAIWQGIRQRCTDGGSFQTRFPHYIGTTICAEWESDFQAFAEWYTSQIGYKDGWDVDKDALSGSKHYSPDTCVLMPRAINLLFGNQWLSSKTSKESKLALIEDRRQEYVPLGVQQVVFDKLTELVNPTPQSEISQH